GLSHEVQVLRKRWEPIRIAQQHVDLAADLLDFDLYVDRQLRLARRTRFPANRDGLRLLHHARRRGVCASASIVPAILVPEQPRADGDQQQWPGAAEQPEK